MMDGDQFPAITLARIGTRLYVIDGHHRLEGARAAGLPDILGSERRMSLDAAHRTAVASNQTHGRNMTSREKQAALQGFIDAGLHLNGLGQPKSLNAILRDFPHYSRGHLGKKLRQLNIDASGEDVADYRYGGWDEPSEEDLALDDAIMIEAFRERLEGMRATFGLLSDQGREIALTALQQLLADLSPKHPAWSYSPLAI